MVAVRWFFIAVFFVVTAVSNFDLGPVINGMMPILSVLSLFISACLHCAERYGVKNLVVFFLMTWIVSHFFEALSIQVGFPFGHYHYETLAGPRVFEVPLIIMPGYFGMAYFSWILSHVLLRQYHRRLAGKQIFLIPFVASFIMCQWDLCMDPISSTLDSLWIWHDGGPYFGVPLQNYFGWFLVVYIFFQLFAMYIAKQEVADASRTERLSRKEFWVEAAVLYGIQGLSQLLAPFTIHDHPEIYGPMALVAFFTMMFVTLLSFIAIGDKNSLR